MTIANITINDMSMTKMTITEMTLTKNKLGLSWAKLSTKFASWATNLCIMPSSFVVDLL